VKWREDDAISKTAISGNGGIAAASIGLSES
jgi:hypothetical protein